MAVKNLKFLNIRIYYVQIARWCGEKKLNFLQKFFRADGVAKAGFCISFFNQQNEPIGE
jgi:hypothetical protein